MKKTKTIKSVIHCILIFIVIIFAQNISYAQIYPGSFEFEGHTRNYSVFLPQNFEPNMPVVLNLPGGGVSIQLQMDGTLMNECADTSGFIVVYPIGINRIWNFDSHNNPPHINDVGFISALIDTLDAHYNIDMARIYCTGFSFGAIMTYRLAAQLGHRFAAVAPISGYLSDIVLNWNPIREMPILNIHGTADARLPYGPRSHWTVEENLNFWVQNNNCSSPADTILLPDIDTTDNSTVEKISWTNCSNNSSIIHYKVINGGHTWPGGAQLAANRDINANKEMWNFFQNYENPFAAWAKSVDVFPGYLDPKGDTIFVKAHIYNPENHPVSVYAKISREGAPFSDSLLLYDDGLHFDENPKDNIWGMAKLFSGLEEATFKVEIYTYDFSSGTVKKYNSLNYFTTIGPVVVDNFEISEQDTNSFTLQYELRNDGSTASAFKITARVSTSDTNVINTKGKLSFGNIDPGQVKGTSVGLEYFTQNNPGSIDFIVHIFSDGRFFWSDSFTVDIVTGIAENEINLPIEYTLKQNYPNPFNPATRIKYQIPDAGLVSLKVYNLLGEVVATLVNEEKSAGTYAVEFDATGIPSGIYFYKLQAGSFIETKKMVLLK